MESREEMLVRLELSVAMAEAALTQAWWSLMGVAVSGVGVFVGWTQPGLVESVGGMLISFAGLGYVVWCGWESRRLVRKSRQLMEGPE